MSETIDGELRTLLDEAAIGRLLKRYARALDERNFAAFASIFTPDALLDFSKVGGPAASHPEIAAWLSEALGQVPELQHFTTNIEIDLAGDHATGKSYTLSISATPLEGGTLGHMVMGAQYLDEFVRTADGWRISARREEGLTVFGHRFGPKPPDDTSQAA